MPSSQKIVEPILEPELPIIDPHHHLWFWRKDAIAAAAAMPNNAYGEVLRHSGRYLLEELLADIAVGHNILGTVFVEAHAMYRASGPDALKTLGEVEFATGVAAMADSGLFGPVRVCAGIVGKADLSYGDAAEDILHAHIAAAGGRYRGVRNQAASDTTDALRNAGGSNPPHAMLDKKFRTGFKYLRKLGLSFDAWVFDPQLPDVIDLAQAFPDTQIILDHVGAPLGVANYVAKERFPIWRENMRNVAACANVAVKVGGMGMSIFGLKGFLANPPFSSEQLTAEWRPYVETCIELFGVDRCMFESNFPVDSGSASYHVLWNTFKRITAKASANEKAALYAGTARKIYRLNI